MTESCLTNLPCCADTISNKENPVKRSKVHNIVQLNEIIRISQEEIIPVKHEVSNQTKHSLFIYS